MRFKPSNRTGASRLWRLRLVSLAVALAAVAAVAVSLTGASSAKNAVGHAAANAKAVQEDGTLVTGTVPKSGKAAHGGTIVAGQLTGQTPTDIDPIINGATCSTDTFQFVTDMYIPLYYGPKGGTPQIDPAHGAAEARRCTQNGDTTVTITIKPGLKWSDGSPVDGQDVAFFYYVLKAATNAAPSNWCQYASPTEFPYNVKSVSYSGRHRCHAPDGTASTRPGSRTTSCRTPTAASTRCPRRTGTSTQRPEADRLGDEPDGRAGDLQQPQQHQRR